jgi:excisionase family DNA binding protein
MTPPEPLLTAEEVAALVRLDVETVRRWAREGLIPSIKLPGGRRRFRRDVVDAVLAGEYPASVAS